MEPLRSSDPRTVGPWQLLNRIGSGGMGVVFMAQRGTQLAALKVVRDSYLDDANARARFKREVNTLRRVSGPFVAAIIDADMDANPAWIASEFVEGPDLKAHVDVHGAMQPAQWELLAGGLLLALAAVHAAGVVHRDIKPANVLLAKDGPKLIDFGIAQAGDGTVLTTTGLAVGSPAWMAPEQVGAKVAGPAADVFCAGSVLLFAATGRAPWGTGSIVEVMGQIASAAPDLSGLTARQQQLLRGLLEKEPARRPSAAQAAQLLTDTTSDAGATQVVADGWSGTPLITVDMPGFGGKSQDADGQRNGLGKGQGDWSDSDGSEYTGERKDNKRNGLGTATYASGATYSGEWKDGVCNGQGTYSYPGGLTYTGEWKDGKYNGQGTLTLGDSSSYTGAWKDGIEHGLGTVKYPAGVAYTGEFKDGQRNGQGTYSYAAGSKYTGKFKDGKFDGQGTYTYYDGSKYTGWWKEVKSTGRGGSARQRWLVWLGAITVLVIVYYATFAYFNRVEYFGQLRNGLAEGIGTRTWPQGDKYTGHFRSDKPHGHGTMTYASGDKYTGEWEANARSGIGTYWRQNGEEYTGAWEDNKKNDQGTYTWPSGNKYIGGYQGDMRNGEGNFRWSNGDKYAGEFKDDVRDGQGTYWYADGSKYTGKYKDDMRNGQGTYSYADGSTYSGEYKYDMRHGFGIFESPDGSKLTGEWKSDVLVP